MENPTCNIISFQLETAGAISMGPRTTTFVSVGVVVQKTSREAGGSTRQKTGRLRRNRQGSSLEGVYFRSNGRRVRSKFELCSVI